MAVVAHGDQEPADSDDVGRKAKGHPLGQGAAKRDGLQKEEWEKGGKDDPETRDREGLLVEKKTEDGSGKKKQEKPEGAG